MDNSKPAAPGNRSSTRSLAIENTAQAYLEILKDRGIKYLFGNAGTDFAPIVDGFARWKALGIDPTPQPIVAPHENAAISMAHGFYMVSGEPQVVMVHVGVGTANALAGLMNAARNNVPIIFTAGRTPITEEGFPGSRDTYIHWAQESFDQAAMVREYVKWDYELRNFAQLETVFDRALEVAMAEPRGPVYLTLPREVLAEEHKALTITSPTRHQTHTRRFPDVESIRAAAQLLTKARSPLIITTSIGKKPEAVQPLVELVDAFSIPVVVMQPRYMNFPSDHPLHLGYNPHVLIGDADVIVVLESDVPWYPSRAKPSSTAHLIHVAEDPFYTRYPVRGYPCDLAIAGDPLVALRQLKEALLKLVTETPDLKSGVDERRQRYTRIHDQIRTQWAADRESAQTGSGIDERWLSYQIGQIIDESTIVVNEYDLVPEQVQLKRPGSLFMNSPAGGLGWGLGAALGAKLASPVSRIIAVVGDGSYIFGGPLACHFVAQKYKLPVLTIIFNNQSWSAVRSANLGMYPTGWAARSGQFPLSELQPSPHYEEVVKACGGYGERVEKSEDLAAALRRALAALDQKQQVVLNVVCKHPGDAATSTYLSHSA